MTGYKSGFDSLITNMKDEKTISPTISVSSNINKSGMDIKELNKLTDLMMEAGDAGLSSVSKANINDGSFNNPILKLGISDPRSSAATFGMDMITFQRNELTSVYHGCWVFRRIVDRVAQDMWSGGITINSEIPPDDLNRVYKRFNRLRSELIYATEQARIYGGAAALIMVDDGEDDLSKPLNLKKIKKGARISFLITDRWYGLEQSSELVTNFKSKDFGKPKYYSFSTQEFTTNETAHEWIHHSRVLRFTNRRSPKIIEQMLMGWGISELEHIYQDLMNHENTKNSVAALLGKALLEIVKLEGMRGTMSGLSGGNPKSSQMFSAQMAALNNYRTNNNLVFMDKNDEYQREDYSFGGLSDIMESQKDIIAGAAEMPKVLLFGDTKGGLSSDSPAEMEFYAQNILGKQEAEIRPILDKLLPVIFRAEGLEIPADLDYEFESIVGMPQEKKLSQLESVVNTATSLVENGLITKKTALKEIEQQQKVTGFGSNIGDEDYALIEKEQLQEEETPEDDETLDEDEGEVSLPGAQDYTQDVNNVMKTHFLDRFKKKK